MHTTQMEVQETWRTDRHAHLWGDCTRITTGRPCAFCRRWSCPPCQRCWMNPQCLRPWLHRWHAAQAGWSAGLSEPDAVRPKVKILGIHTARAEPLSRGMDSCLIDCLDDSPLPSP